MDEELYFDARNKKGQKYSNFLKYKKEISFKNFIKLNRKISKERKVNNNNADILWDERYD